MHYARALMRKLRVLADQHGKTIVIVLHEINYASEGSATDTTVYGPFYREGAPARAFGDSIAIEDNGEAVLWRGRVLTTEGEPVPNALLDVWPIFEAFQLAYVSKGLLLEQEKNASALSPNGPSAGAIDTATPVQEPAPTAPRG